MTITWNQARTCRECGRDLTDPVSLRYRTGPDCRQGMTGEQLRAAMELTRAERQPGYVPPAKAPTLTAVATNRQARAVVEQATAPDVCADHGGLVGRCAGCRHEEADISARIVKLIRAQTHEQRRAERVAILARRYARVAPWRPDPALRPARRTAARPTGPQQLELA